MNTDTHTHNCLMALCPGLPRQAGTRRNIHLLAPMLIIRHPLSSFSIFYDPQHPPYSICVLDSPFPQPVSRSSLVFLLVLDPLLHVPYISSPNHRLLFTTHAHPITACFAVIPFFSSIPLKNFSPLLTWKSVFYLNATHPSHHSHLCWLKCQLIFFPYMNYENSVPDKDLALIYRFLQVCDIVYILVDCWLFSIGCH